MGWILFAWSFVETWVKAAVMVGLALAVVLFVALVRG